jgi:hypothetical protein
MEQNLSEKESKQRLAIGVIFGLIAFVAILRNDPKIAIIFGVGGLGFFFNYFTCFCGTKKALRSFKDKIGSIKSLKR